jgi:Ca-activated chloride channel family protein
MILISDGEDHDSKIKEAVNEAKKMGLKIITVGIGTPNGSPILVKDKSGVIRDYIKDRSGQIVVSKIAILLKSVANETGGKYFDTSVKDISGELSKAVRGLGKNKNKISKIDRFQIFLYCRFVVVYRIIVSCKKIKEMKI